MEHRIVTIDTGATENTVFSLDTKASPAEILGLAMKLGYLTIPAGTTSRRGASEARQSREAYVPLSRIVEVS